MTKTIRFIEPPRSRVEPENDTCWCADSEDFPYWYVKSRFGRFGAKTLCHAVWRAFGGEDVTIVDGLGHSTSAWKVRGQWFYRQNAFFDKALPKGLPVAKDDQGWYVTPDSGWRAPRPELACAFWVKEARAAKQKQQAALLPWLSASRTWRGFKGVCTSIPSRRNSRSSTWKR